MLAAMPWASLRGGIKFIPGCGDSIANAINSGALADFRAIVSSAASWLALDASPAQQRGMQCCRARRLPLSTSAAIALCAAKAAENSMAE